MHPAYSVIVFTTASGAGYGLLAWLGALMLRGQISPASPLALAGLLVSLALITSGLLASTLHLGRPERAWRALNEWRTSWLSREGVAAIATYVPATVLLLAALAPAAVPSAIVKIAAGLALLGAIATVWCTGSIYASLKTIRAWTEPTVVPTYIVLSLASGALLLLLLVSLFGRVPRELPLLAVGALVAGWVLKAAYWGAIDGAERSHTIEAATGLGRFGKVRQLEPPHTGPNYVMREMGYEVARRHAVTLRRAAVVLAFLLPLAVLVPLRLMPAGLSTALLTLAVLAAAAGLLIERWLFFAEAEHVSMLYYGREKA